MSNPIHQRLSELYRELAEVHSKLADEPSSSRPAQAEAVQWVKLKEFCESHELGESTVRRYIREGMPHKLLGPRNIRINVQAAEAWLEDRGASARSGGEAA